MRMDMVETEKLVLRDFEREVRAELSVEPNGPQLRFFDPGGRERVSLGIHNLVYGLMISDERGESRLSVEVTDSHLFDTAGPRATIRFVGEGSWPLLLTVGRDNRPHLVFYDAKGRARVHVTVDKNGQPRIRRHRWWRTSYWSSNWSFLNYPEDYGAR